MRHLFMESIQYLDSQGYPLQMVQICLILFKRTFDFKYFKYNIPDFSHTSIIMSVLNVVMSVFPCCQVFLAKETTYQA